jgi:putative two-component system response regulator
MKKETVLVVDDVEMNRLILEEILMDHYSVAHASNGIEAVSCMFSGAVTPDIVLLDIMMPEMDGYEVLELLQSNPQTAKVPVIFITAADAETNETRGLSLGAVDYISKPFNPEVVKIRVSNHLKLRHYSESLEEMVQLKVEELVRTKERMLETMASIIEYRNLETGHHVKRTSELSRILVDYLYKHPHFNRIITDEDHDSIVKAVPLHDIGKISIPDSVLLKPGPLTTEEFETIKTHSAIGSEIIRFMQDTDDDPYLIYCYDICRFHHERWDGNGYPDKLKGGDIPLPARILAVVDVYDALVSARVYKPPLSHNEAIEIIQKGAGSQFDPEIIRALMDVHKTFETLNLVE